VGHPHASSSKIDCKSLFRNILPASPVRSIFYGEACKAFKTWELRLGVSVTESISCGETRKVFKKWDLRLGVSVTESIFCKQNIDNKDFIF